MYLSALILNPRSREARRDMADVYQMHRTLMRAFPDQEDGGPGEVLWRLDIDRRSGASRLLVQSEKAPAWERVIDEWPQYFADEISEGEPTIRCKVLPDIGFQQGQQLSFRLRANPTVKREGKRHGLLTDEEMMDWLHRKAQTLGFRVSRACVISERPREGRKGRGRSMTFASALFEGQLVVTQPGAFHPAIHSGIGPAKAFGFGLLSLAPC